MSSDKTQFSLCVQLCELTKAEHESGLPMAHYRYGNSWVCVTGDHRSMWIWVHVLGAVSTCHGYLWDYFFT